MFDWEKSGVDSVNDWYSGIKHTPERKGKVTDQDNKTEPYAQVIWKSTTEIGCGAKKGFIVCQYGGGKYGENYEENVKQMIYPEHECKTLGSWS